MPRLRALPLFVVALLLFVVPAPGTFLAAGVVGLLAVVALLRG